MWSSRHETGIRPFNTAPATAKFDSWYRLSDIRYSLSELFFSYLFDIARDRTLAYNNVLFLKLKL